MSGPSAFRCSHPLSSMAADVSGSRSRRISENRLAVPQVGPPGQQPVQPLPAPTHRPVDVVDRVTDHPGHCPAFAFSQRPRSATHYIFLGRGVSDAVSRPG